MCVFSVCVFFFFHVFLLCADALAFKEAFEKAVAKNGELMGVKAEKKEEEKKEEEKKEEEKKEEESK